MSKGTQSFLRLTRTLHAYLTMFSSIVLFVFALTGFMLNHGAWFGLESGRRPPGMQRGAGQPSVRSSAALAPRGPDASMEHSDRSDGGGPDHRRGFLVKLTSLHKGKPSSLPVVLLIDTTAIVLMLGSITGVILLLSAPRRRRLGLVLMGVGTLAGLITLLLMP